MDGTFAAESATLRDVMTVLQATSNSLAVAVDASGTLAGVVSDGDVRRALLDGAALDDLAGPFIKRDAVKVGPAESRSSVLDLMQARRISAVPIVDDELHCLGVHTLTELLGRKQRPNVAVVMAGGRGSRLLPADSPIPKPMVKVAGRPILERLINHLVGFGISEIALSVGFRAEVIESYFGSGNDHGCTIHYIADDPASVRGTAGALSQLASVRESLEAPLLVLNGDLVTQANLDDLLSAHDQSGVALTVATHVYTHQVPYGVIEGRDDGRVVKLLEKPTLRRLVNAGIYVVNPSLLPLVPVEGSFNMTELIERCLHEGLPVGYWHSNDEWFDVGRPTDLAAARGIDSEG